MEPDNRLLKMFSIGLGDKIGRTIYKTSSMGASFGVRHDVKKFLDSYPNMKDIVDLLLAANTPFLIGA